VAIEADVTFDSNGTMTPGITHATGAAGIALGSPGDYKITFSVSGTEPNQMALFLNGALVTGSIYGSGAGTQQNTGQVIVSVPGTGEVLTLKNHSSSSAVGLASDIGGTQATSTLPSQSRNLANPAQLKGQLMQSDNDHELRRGLVHRVAFHGWLGRSTGSP